MQCAQFICLYVPHEGGIWMIYSTQLHFSGKEYDIDTEHEKWHYIDKRGAIQGGLTLIQPLPSPPSCDSFRRN